MSSLLKKLHFKVLSPPTGLPLKNVNTFIATWGGVGLIRPAPGTLGTLAAIPFGYGIMYVGGILSLLAATIILTVIGTMAAKRYAAKSGTTDDQSIVVDEVVGLWLAALPAGLNPVAWLIAFVLFRLFDIWKPWPASFFDRRSKNAFDVMLDDVIAGIYAMFGVATYALLTLS